MIDPKLGLDGSGACSRSMPKFYDIEAMRRGICKRCLELGIFLDPNFLFEGKDL